MKDFLKTVAGIVLFIAVAVGASALWRIISHKPSVILTSTGCNSPCWYGIMPGQTNSSQVYEILNQLGFVNIDSITGDSTESEKLTKIYWHFQRPVEDGTGSVYFENDQVTAINILTQNSLTLDDLFAKLGQPEMYWAEIGQGEYQEFLEVVLLNPEKGYLAHVVIDVPINANQVEIKGNTPVLRVAYFSPEAFQDLLESRTLIDRPAGELTGVFKKWSGFGALVFERK